MLNETDQKPSIYTVLAQFRAEATSNRDLGDRFERLICRYLELDPLYSERFSNVWLWNEWPRKGKVGDVGIDIVAEERATGHFCAIQCKFYLPEHTISKEDIDSFFTAAGKDLFTSCMIVSTTDRWGKNAEEALINQSKPVTRLTVHDLDASPIDWSRFSLKRPDALSLCPKKKTLEHQNTAIKNVLDGFSSSDRGQLIMACGTGKTFTALRIAEKITPHGHVLFLVPSLSLLAQSLREWTAESARPLHCLAVCSDTSIGKDKRKPDEDKTDLTPYDLAFPPTTSASHIVKHYRALHTLSEQKKRLSQMTVVFSTYQSIEAVAEAQRKGLPEFDLIISDEAHRTTGVTLSGEDESQFVKVHDAKFLKGRKRLYMTATPRVYADEAKKKAGEVDAELCSMDDVGRFGPVLHRLGFGEAVSKALLSDYKVLVLAVDEKYVTRAFQRQLADPNKELNLDDAVRITGCWNGLSKKFDQASVVQGSTAYQPDAAPMRRAVAFSRSIKDSKAFVEKFGQIVSAYRNTHADSDGMLQCELEHVDGTMDALKRNAKLDWLKASSPENTCRILSNARCLSEGVDVPALDAVLFLNPRKSTIDVVQSVGRVMRRAEGKHYGYIILPIGIPAGVPPEEALKDNEKYKIVWQVLQALRAHDDRFNAIVNQIELNKNRPDVIQVVGVGADDKSSQGDSVSDGDSRPRVIQIAFAFPELEQWKDAIYARIVDKCGDRRYWESWAQDVAVIADRHADRIHALLEGGEPRHKKAFAKFLAGLRENINPSITEVDAVEMLSQHLITRPVFDALFENYAFSQHNPVSQAMQHMLDTLQDQALEKETTTLDKFYASVRQRAAGIDNAAGRQRVVIELYEKFFRAAFPKMAERLGIVYTPVEVVDFIIRSVEDVLKQEFNSSLGAERVHVIDPFTGTGTFIVRLLQSGLIGTDDLLRKYEQELHANEIVLLAYYIAAINIEETFYRLQRADHSAAKSTYRPFDGIVLTDTFQLSETKGELEEKMFPENNRRLQRQKQAPITVVMSNPPYSVGQGDANANNQNLKYPILDERIRHTYAARSSATNKNSLYDSYIRAIRWASDRINGKGVVAFVSNNSFIDGNALDGLRVSLTGEFSTIYVFNLRGNQRTAGETSRMEGGKIFGSGSRAGIAISVFVRNPSQTEGCELYYHDIGDYRSREDKLGLIRTAQSITGLQREKKWHLIHPNASHDWINQRDPAFERFVSVGEKRETPEKTIFQIYSRGLETARDAWCYNFSRALLTSNVSRMIRFYNDQVEGFASYSKGKRREDLPELAKTFIDTDPKQISWSSSLLQDLQRLHTIKFEPMSVTKALYRPFCKMTAYVNGDMVHRVGQFPRIFPTPKFSNRLICMTGVGNRVDFSALITDCPADLHMADANGASQCFPLYLYEKDEPREGQLLSIEPEGELIDGYHRREAVTDSVLSDFRAAYKEQVTKEDVFYYVYGILHSNEYRTRFSSDLKKMLPRIPLTQQTGDFWRFSRAGRALAELHLNYESVEPWPVQEVTTELFSDSPKHFIVQKLTFGRVTAEQRERGEKVDKTTIHYNSYITLTGIPIDAYDYVVNGKSAIEWIIERYQLSVDKDSGIRNDPNDWAKEQKQPRYILDLVKRIVRVSMETLKIVRDLPALNERTT